jgi:hypothetical protein
VLSSFNFVSLPRSPPPLPPYDEVRRVIDAKDQAVTRDVSAGDFDAAASALDELDDLGRGVAGAGDISLELVAQITDAVAGGRRLLEKRRRDAAEAERLKAEYEEATRRAEEEAKRAASEAERAASEAKKSQLLQKQVAKMEETSREEKEAAERLRSKYEDEKAESAAALEKLKTESEAELERVREKAVAAESDEVRGIRGGHGGGVFLSVASRLGLMIFERGLCFLFFSYDDVPCASSNFLLFSPMNAVAFTCSSNHQSTV